MSRVSSDGFVWRCHVINVLPVMSWSVYIWLRYKNKKVARFDSLKKKCERLLKLSVNVTTKLNYSFIWNTEFEPLDTIKRATSQFSFLKIIITGTFIINKIGTLSCDKDQKPNTWSRRKYFGDVRAVISDQYGPLFVLRARFDSKRWQCPMHILLKQTPSFTYY